jgi:hypothetical protein
MEGAPGSGKSSLALALIDRGAVLIGDDGVLLASQEDRLIARPHPRTRGLLEVRNLGLLSFPICEAAPVALIVLLDPQAPRFVEEAQTVMRAGFALPLIRLAPEGPVLHIKTECALTQFGLTWG